LSNQKHTSDFPTAPLDAAAVVYFVKIGKRIKIGFTTNLNERLKAFQGLSPEPINVLLTIPGGRKLETRLHQLFAEHRIRNEFFHDEFFLSSFINMAKQKGVATAFEWIERWQQEWKRRARLKAEEFVRRVAEQRKTRAEEDAYYASLVGERKRTLGL
jgi:hypothetical protein